MEEVNQLVSMKHIMWWNALHHVRSLIMHLIRVRRHSFGYTRIHTFYIGDPAFAHAAMSNTNQVSHVAVWFPTLWVKDPAIWSIQTEASFRRARITSQQMMFDYILEKLPEDVTSIRDLLVSVRTNRTEFPYDRIKARQVNRLITRLVT